jgi:hypothetical protein
MVDGVLHFLSPTEQRKMQTFAQTIQSERRASDVYIRGSVWRDGRDPGGIVPAKNSIQVVNIELMASS